MADHFDSKQTAPAKFTGGGGAVPKSSEQTVAEQRKWFVAIVRQHKEKLTAQQLAEDGFETYVAIQRRERQWSQNRKKVIDHVVIGRTVFLHATETERLKAIHHPYVDYFMMDRSSNRSGEGLKCLAIVPDHELEQLRRLLAIASGDVEIAESPFRKGDPVTIVNGQLKGFTGYVDRGLNGNARFLIHINCLGFASVELDATDLELLEP